MITNADITIYNRKYNKETRLDDWQSTVIRGVHFYLDNHVSVGDGAINSADTCKIRIPANVENASDYLFGQIYADLADVGNHWTIRTDDIVVQGVCDAEIDKPSDLKLQGIQYYKITSWSDNRFGSLPHWRIGGI